MWHHLTVSVGVWSVYKLEKKKKSGLQTGRVEFEKKTRVLMVREGLMGV